MHRVLNEILCGDMKVKSESGLVQTFVANTGENKTPLGALLLVHRNPKQTSCSSGTTIDQGNQPDKGIKKPHSTERE